MASGEQILVVARSVLQRSIPIMGSGDLNEKEQSVIARSADSARCSFGDADMAWEALKAISVAYEFVDRDKAEHDASIKQVIPYVMVRHGERVLLLRRLRAQSERRLWDKYSIGIGGHLNPSDGGKDFFDVLLSGLERELHEELEISTDYACRLIGCINDDSDDVGRVHFGIAFQAILSEDSVRVRESEKLSGQLVGLDELLSVRDGMESWSRILLDHFLCRSSQARGV